MSIDVNNAGSKLIGSYHLEKNNDELILNPAQRFQISERMRTQITGFAVAGVFYLLLKLLFSTKKNISNISSGSITCMIFGFIVLAIPVGLLMMFLLKVLFPKQKNYQIRITPSVISIPPDTGKGYNMEYETGKIKNFGIYEYSWNSSISEKGYESVPGYCLGFDFKSNEVRFARGLRFKEALQVFEVIWEMNLFNPDLYSQSLLEELEKAKFSQEMKSES